MRSCRFDRALLREVDLRECDLSGSSLRGCDLRGSDLRGANLRDADLRGAIGLTAQQLADSNTNAHTRLPVSLQSTVPNSIGTG